MIFNQANKYQQILLLTFFFCVAYAYSFDQKLNLGGDNLAYYYLGKSLKMGLGYSNITGPEITPHTHFPPGYPVIISGLMLILEGVTFIKLMNGLFGLGTLLISYLFFKKVLGSSWLACLAIIFLAVNRHFLEYSFIMMSEIPFLFFLMLGVYLLSFLNFDTEWYKSRIFLSLIIVAAITFYIRSFGIVLILGLAFNLLMQKKWSYLLAFFFGLFLLLLPWYIRNYELSAGAGYLSQLMMINPYDSRMGQIDIYSLLSRIGSNGLRYLDKEIIYLIFNSAKLDYAREASFLSVILTLSLIALLVYGISKLRDHKFFFVGLFLSAAGILLLWPSLWYGVRFVLPLLILLMLFTFYGFCMVIEQSGQKLLSKKLPYLLILVLIVSQLPYLSVLKNQKKMDYPEGFRDYFLASQWINENSKPTDIVACRKPLLSHHFSKLPTVQWSNSWKSEEVIAGFNAQKVKYVIVDMLGYSSTREKILPLFDLYSEKFEPVKRFDATATFIAKYTSYLGYNGDLKDGKKNGNGIYISKNGSIYKGQWYNDMKNGVGSFKSGRNADEIIGIWKNDTLIHVLSKDELQREIHD